MPVYTMKFSEDGRGEAKRIEFAAENASAALVVAHNEASNRCVELWCEDQCLCLIQRIGQDGDVWLVMPQPRHAASHRSSPQQPHRAGPGEAYRESAYAA